MQKDETVIWLFLALRGTSKGKNDILSYDRVNILNAGPRKICVGSWK
jgi:hypothetical protein